MGTTKAEHDAWLEKIMDAVRSLRADGLQKAAAASAQRSRRAEEAPPKHERR